MADKKSPGLWIETGDNGKICVVTVNSDGQEQRLPPISPAEDLIAAVEIDYGAYRQEIQQLYEEHPLFEEQLDISLLDLEDLAEEALLLLPMLREIDPLSLFEVSCLLDQALRMEDDGSALFLLQAGWRLVQILELPIRTQIRLRNIMEISFDGMERATQQERWEKLCGAYPDTAKSCDPARLDRYGASAFPLHVDSVYQLRLAELSLYFRQDKKRIAREARRAYVAGHITAEEFLRRINTTRELRTYDTVKQELLSEETVWQRRVTGNPDFDPLQEYPSSIMVLDFRKAEGDPQWQTLSREDLVRKDQEGHQSLRDEYGRTSEKSSE